ncbi:nuclear receptor-binding factor 2 [Vanessa tameamea]|uniref:Nuclear receptor-binding factor 2 n=1 Tax=Vanessa tameamea TaxID=334116 RepID=A0A8B8I123_VANTA|nr:nuclear receptor-binding factor 2 [Vanessa tameamea]
MEFHPLNLAHQQHRRAEAHLKNNRYDEAIQCHHNAAELLLDALKSTNSSVALESITLQHNYHLKQKDLIKNKKEQYVRVKKALDNIKHFSKDPQFNLNGNDISTLQVAIYKAVNESDNLLCILSDKCKGSNEKDSVDVTDGNVTEKSQQMIVEEVQSHNQNLQTMIEQLLLKVEVIKDDNITLKERVNYLEKERVKYLNIQSQDESLERNDFSALSLLSDGYGKDSSREQTPSMGKPYHINLFE